MDDETSPTAGGARLRAALAEIAAALDDAEPGEDRAARRAVLAEARNVAERFEAYIHMNFTVSADQMFADGKLSREERIALSGAIGAALDAFRASLSDSAPDLYTRDPYEGERRGYYESAALVEDARPVPLREATAVAADGTIDACLITPGWGSSGYYPAEVLRRDGPQVFAAGLHSYLDHPTMTEEAERPERSVKDLAGALAENAAWREDGWNGPGLYARIAVAETERATVDALAPLIGLSIRASGVGRPGEAEGRRGLVVERLTAAHSVDFVTVPGRGGAIRVLAEAARRAAATKPHKENRPMDEKDDKGGEFREAAAAAETKQLREALARLEARADAAERRALLSEAREFVTRTLAANEALPELARVRIATQVQPVIADGAFDQAATLKVIEAAVETEIAYITTLAGPGRIRGLGESAPAQADPAKLQADLAEAFSGLGLGETAAKIAARGR